MDKGAGPDVIWVTFVILVEYRVRHDGLAVNGQNRVCRYVYPIFSLKGQGFAGHEDKVGSLVLAIHLVFSVGRIRRPGHPLRSRRIIQTGCLVGGAANVPCAEDTVAIRDGKVEQAPRIHVFILQDSLWDRVCQFVDLSNCLLQGLAQHSWTKTRFGGRARIVTQSLEGVEKQGKCPFAVSAPLDLQIPLVC